MTNASKIALFCALFALFSHNLNAQKKTFDDVLSIELRNTGPILKSDEVTGYFMFYKLDKVDRKTNAYLLRILDANLNEVGSHKIKESQDFHLQEAAYDGASIMLKFYDFKDKQASFYMYDGSAQLKSKKSYPLSKYEIQMANASKDQEIKSYSLFDLPGKGFLNYATTKEKEVGYDIRFFPEDPAVKGWSEKSNPKSKDVEIATFLAANDEVLYSSIVKRPSWTSQKVSYHLMGTDLKTGKKIFEKQLEDSQYKMQVLNGYTDETTGNVALFGLYYDIDDKIAKDKSLGLFAISIDNKGDFTSKKFLSWGKDVSKLLPMDKKGKIEDVGYLFFHKIFKTADGNVFAVGEQYRRGVSGEGIATALLGGGISMSKIVVEDLVIFEFSPDFSLKAVKIFDKEKSDVLLPSGAGFLSTQMLSLVVKAFDGYDYSFTQMNSDKSVFSVGYVDYEKKKKGEKKGSWVFGAVTRADNDFTTDKLSLQTEASSIRVLPGKPGYIVVSEYFKKEKKLDMRLEKINY